MQTGRAPEWKCLSRVSRVHITGPLASHVDTLQHRLDLRAIGALQQPVCARRRPRRAQLRRVNGLQRRPTVKQTLLRRAGTVEHRSHRYGHCRRQDALDRLLMPDRRGTPSAAQWKEAPLSGHLCSSLSAISDEPRPTYTTWLTSAIIRVRNCGWRLERPSA